MQFIKGLRQNKWPWTVREGCGQGRTRKVEYRNGREKICAIGHFSGLHGKLNALM